MDIVFQTLKNHKKYGNDGVMFDIDDTIIRSSDDSIIQDILNLLNYAYKLGYRIVLITARPPQSQEYTQNQLRDKRIPYHELYFSPAGEKGALKRNLDIRFVLSVGDQETDCTDSMFSLKLPHQTAPRGYFKSN